MPLRAHVCALVALTLGAAQVGACSRSALDPDFENYIGCTPGTLALSRAYPTVMFVIDRSTSMTESIGSANRSRWEALKDGLKATLPAIGRDVQLGALIFPADAGADVCSVGKEATLKPAPENVENLITLMNAAEPKGGTPTAKAIDAAAQTLLKMRTSHQARALVLATDGLPDCNDSLDASMCRCAKAYSRFNCPEPVHCLDDDATNERIAYYAKKERIPTYVLGIQTAGDDSFTDVLNSMAISGGRPKLNSATKYYAASSESELDAALSAISGLVGACVYLTTSVPNASGTIQLSLDGAPITADAWQWQDRQNGEIALGPEACSQVLGLKSPRLAAQVTCGKD